MKTLDMALSIIGLLFIALIGWDLFESVTYRPEGILYTIFRTPRFYPSEIQQEIEVSQADLEQMRIEMAEQLIKEMEANRTNCVSFAGLSNALCIGPKQTTE